jgi:hypothetical protein
VTRPKPDEQPTTVLPAQTVEQPAVSTAPATRRAGVWSHVPPRIGRARTSTVVIGALFILLFAANSALPEADPFVTVPTSDGGTVRVRQSQYTPAPTTPTTTAPATSSVPVTTTAPRTTSSPRSTTSAPSSDDEETTSPRTSEAESSDEAPTTSSAPSTTSRAPSTTAAQSSSAPTS